MTAKSNSELVERLRKYSDPVHIEEFYMKRWDKIRGYIAAGHKGSWPRDVFESLIDGWAQDAMEAASALESQAAEIAKLREAVQSYVDPITYEDILARAALAETPAGLDRQGPRTDAG